MELKRLVTQFTYRIEPKPEGGFIAHASDPNIPPLEAPTRDELQQKIQATIMAGLAEKFPGLNIPAQNQDLKFSFHIEHKPGGGFALHSADPNAGPIEGTREEIENHFAEKLIGLVGEHLMPELAQALDQQGGAGDVKVFVNRKTYSLGSGSHKLTLGLASNLAAAGSPAAPDNAALPTNAGDASTPNRASASLGGTISAAPITPERSSGSSVLLFAVAVAVLAGLVYFFLYPH